MERGDRYGAGDYFARLVRIDGEIAGDAELYLDAIELPHAMRWIVSRDVDSFVTAAPHPGVVVHAAGDQGDLLNIPGDRAGLNVGDWFRLRLGDSGYPADYAENTNLAVDQAHTFIQQLSSVSSDEAKTLSQLHELQGQGPSSVPSVALSTGLAADYWVACMNMGQGSCVAVMPATGRPVAYVDIGFPTMPYTRTAPENWVFKQNDPAGFALGGLRQQRDPRTCICDDPLIIFTHWDWDHWYQAELMRRRLASFSLDVLAPKTPTTGTTVLNFWAQLPPNQLTLFPQSGWMAFDWGFVVRCSGPVHNSNQSGVAALIRVKAGATTMTGYPKAGVVSVPHFAADEYYVLVSGDADYGNITYPTTNGPNLVGMVATHHGADGQPPVLVPRSIPTPLGGYSDPRIVYSYGLADAAVGGQQHCYRVRRPRHGGPGHARYGHPRPAATAAYNAHGWTRRLDTAAVRSVLGPPPANVGHVFISHPPAPVRTTGCLALGACTGETTMVRCVT